MNLIGKDPKNIRLALIENAAEVEQEPKDWVIRNRRALQNLDLDLEIVDLKAYFNDQSTLENKLASQDVIWIGGGNAYYLRWLLKKTGADRIIQELVSKGIVYAGGSAGAIVVGPTLKFFETADDPSAAPETILDGLSLTETVIVPHMDNPKFTSLISTINNKLKKAGYKTAPLNDSQALVINGHEQVVI